MHMPGKLISTWNDLLEVYSLKVINQFSKSGDNINRPKKFDKLDNNCPKILTFQFKYILCIVKRNYMRMFGRGHLLYVCENFWFLSKTIRNI